MQLKKTEYGREGIVPCKCSLTGEKIDVCTDEDVTDDYAEKCIESLNNLSDDIIEEICIAAKKYCMKMKELYEEAGEEEWTEVPVTSDTKAEEMIKYFDITGIVIEEADDESVIGYRLGGGCDWEIEHGIEIIIRDNKVLYLGSYDGNSPWHDYDKDDEWNFVN